jgi:hypothetical protein
MSSRLLDPMPNGWEPPRHVRSPTSERLLRRCLDVLGATGAVDGGCLRDTCRHARTCWSGIEGPTDDVRPRLPWIGPEYERARVLVIGMGAQSHGGLWDESYCVLQAIDQLEANRQRFFGDETRGHSWFHYRAAVVAGLLVDASGDRPPVLRTPAEAVGPLMASARAQAVQCVPASTSRRTPGAHMSQTCPPHLLWPMVEILRPRFIALLGAAPRAAFETRYGKVLRPRNRLLRVGKLKRRGHSARVVALSHPSSGYGMRSIEALHAALSTGALWTG